ncbi:GtrA family protein [Erythrobacter dokdonensis]|uniref:GtrA-like protein n=1 Tax=Erythrobacter dokdonensis DSW-74 TaxID=1300349 RepID=A0A1A7BF15_9SPHN|nr:GtrA family protein [Erythrobacter dokdonensis]OBV11074.1 GtrA-like protein [Erythrobacter dokdonensis DSW-74]
MIRPLSRLALRLADIRFLRYLAASVGALAVDVSVFFACLALGVAAGPASALGYSLGVVAHWLMSSRAVFHQGVAAQGRERTMQKVLFVVSALAGLALTTLIVTLADRAGIDPRLAKLPAIIASFALTYILRAMVVFRENTGS